MARKQAIGGARSPSTTPRSPTPDVQRTGGASKNGQYPGRRQNVGEAEAGQDRDHLAPPVNQRGSDPALAGNYVRSAQSRSQGAAPGKDQVKNPNEPLASAYPGGQYPGIPVPLTYGEGFDGVSDPGGNQAGAKTRGAQEREGSVGGAAGGQYPGVAQAVEGLAGAGAPQLHPLLGIDVESEADALNVRDVGTSGNVGNRHVAPPEV